jgi:hypothetical protein
LTDRLRAQHAQLDAMLEAMQRTGAAGAEGRERLQQARQAMLDHLALEQDRLYPALLEHPAAGRLARQYAGEMAQLAPAVIAFFDAYRDGGADALGFARSLGQLLVVLRERVGREEAWLYPVYEVHCERSDG